MVCSNKVPIGWIEAVRPRRCAFGVGAWMRTRASDSRPMRESGTMVRRAIRAPIAFAFSAMATRLVVSPEPDPMTRRSSAAALGVAVSPTTKAVKPEMHQTHRKSLHGESGRPGAGDEHAARIEHEVDQSFRLLRRDRRHRALDLLDDLAGVFGGVHGWRSLHSSRPDLLSARALVEQGAKGSRLPSRVGGA